MSDPFHGLPRHHFGAIVTDLSDTILAKLARDPAAAIELGKAAEHLVCADVILSGYRCYLSDQGLPYDVVVDVDSRLIRIQVKAVCFPRDMTSAIRAPRHGYTFSIRRRGKNGQSRLTDQDCDLVALVALDIRQIAYMPISEAAQTCQLMPPGWRSKGHYKQSKLSTIDCWPLEGALERMELPRCR